METNRRTVAEEAAARTSEAMERVRSGKKELEDRIPQMALPEHPAESFTKRHPMEAALGALSAGFLLTRFLPIRALLSGAARLLWMLAKPAGLLFLGAWIAKGLRDQKRLS